MTGTRGGGQQQQQGVIPACQFPFAPGVIPGLGAAALSVPPHAPTAKLLLLAGQIKLKMNEAVKLMEAGLGREECCFLS